MLNIPFFICSGVVAAPPSAPRRYLSLPLLITTAAAPRSAPRRYRSLSKVKLRLFFSLRSGRRASFGAEPSSTNTNGRRASLAPPPVLELPSNSNSGREEVVAGAADANAFGQGA